jgi:hypothetical protein
LIIVFEERHDSPRQRFNVFELALPNGKDSPALRPQFSARLSIPSFVGFEFFQPKLQVRFRRFSLGAAGMGVPEAAVYEYDFLTS